MRCEYMFFYKVAGLQRSGLQNRCFLVNNMKFLRTLILQNICEPLNSAFLKLTLWGSWKKPILKTKWQKLINKYENTFIWTLHAAMKRNHWNVSLNLYYRHAQSNSYRVLNLKWIPRQNLLRYEFYIISKHLDKFSHTAIWLFQFHVDQFSY